MTEETELWTCQRCGEEINGGEYKYAVETRNGTETWCEACKDDNAFYCDSCDCYYDCDAYDSIYTEDTNCTYCEGCRDDNAHYCCECNEWYENDIEYVCDSGSEWVCESCQDAHGYHYCDDCGDLYHCDDLCYHEDIDAYFCPSCDGNHDDGDAYGILSYNDEHDTEWIVQKATNETEEPKIKIGTETEVVYDSLSSEDTKYIKENIPCVLSYDGSVSRGYEIVTHPMSIEYIKEHETDFERVYNYLMDKGYKSHDTNCCGLHVHVTRPSDEAIDRILFIMETYKEELIAFSRRTTANLTQWASFLSDYTGKQNEVKSLEFINKIKGTSNRYMALNLQNRSTIEFRLFRGTLNVNTYYATIELVYNLVTACSDLNKPLSEITWEYLTHTKHAKAYVEDRGIRSNKVPRDMTKELLKQFKKVQIEKTKIVKLLLSDVTKKMRDINIAKINLNITMSDEEVENNTFSTLYDFSSELTRAKAYVDTISNLISGVLHAKDKEAYVYSLKEWRTYNNFYSHDLDDKINAIIGRGSEE